MFTASTEALTFDPPEGIELGSPIKLSISAFDQQNISIMSLSVRDDQSLDVSFEMDAEDIDEETYSYLENINPERSIDDVSDQEWDEHRQIIGKNIIDWAMHRLETVGIPTSACRNIKLIEKEIFGTQLLFRARFFVEPIFCYILSDEVSRHVRVDAKSLSVSMSYEHFKEIGLFHRLRKDVSDGVEEESQQLTEQFAYLFPWYYWWQYSSISSYVSRDASADCCVTVSYEFTSPCFYDANDVLAEGDELPLFAFTVRPVLKD